MAKTITAFQGQPSVTGTIASLAASGSVNVIFDLGTDWATYPVIAVWINIAAPATAAATLTCSGYTDQDATRRRLPQAYTTGGVAGATSSVTPSGGAQCMLVRPLGRYIEANVVNGDATNAFGAASSIGIATYSA